MIVPKWQLVCSEELLLMRMKSFLKIRTLWLNVVRKEDCVDVQFMGAPYERNFRVNSDYLFIYIILYYLLEIIVFITVVQWPRLTITLIRNIFPRTPSCPRVLCQGRYVQKQPASRSDRGRDILMHHCYIPSLSHNSLYYIGLCVCFYWDVFKNDNLNIYMKRN